MLEVKHLTVRSKEGRPLVQDVSFTLTPGKPMGLTGASGSGKTTIIKAVMGILPYGCAIESGRDSSGWAVSGRASCPKAARILRNGARLYPTKSDDCL